MDSLASVEDALADEARKSPATADQHRHPVSIRRRLLCLLRGHLPGRLRAFVDGRTISTCTRCGASVRRGKNMRWQHVR